MSQTFRGFSDRARILRMLALWFGASDGERWFGYLAGMMNRQKKWPWLGLYLSQSPRRQYDLLGLAASELILLADQNPGVPVNRQPEGGSSLLVRAWAEACRWAWRDAGMTGKGEPRWESLDALLDDNPNHPVAGMAEPETDGPPDLNLDGLTPEHLRLLAARAAGASFPAIAAGDGVVWQTVAYRWRQAVRALLGANPWLAERYRLTPCPAHGRADRECPHCKGFGFTYTDGEPLIHRRQQHA